MRRSLEDLLAFLLCDTAKHTELFALGLEFLEIIEAMKDLLLGFVSDRTRVVKDQVSRLYCVHLSVALLHERADDFFGIMHIHLAAKGFQVKRFLRGGHPRLV